jgi:hypothetical protein
MYSALLHSDLRCRDLRATDAPDPRFPSSGGTMNLAGCCNSGEKWGHLTASNWNRKKCKATARPILVDRKANEWSRPVLLQMSCSCRSSIGRNPIQYSAVDGSPLLWPFEGRKGLRTSRPCFFLEPSSWTKVGKNQMTHRLRQSKHLPAPAGNKGNIEWFSTGVLIIEV